MKPQITNTTEAASLNASPSITLRGRSLSIARGLWVAVAASIFVLFAFAVPAEFEHLRTPCVDCDGPRITFEQAQRLGDLGFSAGFYAAYTLALEACFAVTAFAVALLIFARRSDDGVALLAALALLGLGSTFPGTTLALAESSPAWELPVAIVGLLGLVAFTLFFCLFPGGQFAPRWTLWLFSGLIVLMVPAHFFPDSSVSVGTWPPLIQLVFYLIWLGGLMGAQVHRYRRVSNLTERQQTKWVVFGFVAAIAGFLVSISLYPFFPQASPLAYLAGNTSIYFSMTMIPLAFGVAILRHHLFDIDFVVNRALVYGALTASLVGLYVLVVGGLGKLLQTPGSLFVSLLGAGFVAVLFAPLRERIQHRVNRVMYGERYDPYAALSRLGQHFESTLAPDAMLPTAVSAVAEALKLPYAAVETERDGTFQIAAAVGEPVEEPVHLPLIYAGETVGRLALSPRLGETDFSSADRRLLDDLARQVSIAVHAMRLTEEALRLSEDLQSSRERLVTAREEERRRLRRDLHDGLGPQLASLAMKSEAARELMACDPVRADTLLLAVTERAQETVADIRRLVHGLRPPALDDLGLIGALRSQAAHGDHNGLRVSVEVPVEIPPLPAAVEVACYRIVQEAMTNVVRHADADGCTVRLAFDATSNILSLEIADDGRGIPADRRAGVGLHSMRERAEELGGSFEIIALPEGGTLVAVSLSVPDEVGGPGPTAAERGEA